MYLSEGTSVDLDLAVVGGGLAGLSAAALVAQAGRSVVIFEQASDIGGRAVTQVRQGISFNLGPHALYFLGDAFKLLGELGVSFTGRVPSPGKSRLLREDGLTPLPHGLASLLQSPLFSLRDKTRLIRFLATLRGLKTYDTDGISLSRWVRSAFGAGNAASFLLALFRVTTYADDADQISAGAAHRTIETRPGGQRLVYRRGLAETYRRPALLRNSGGCDHSDRYSSCVGA